jgi:hypothetical protein|tara:strand:+ start:1320 stop:1889 length:570 start_codon:yes stop_codon:yes gene_type:complete
VLIDPSQQAELEDFHTVTSKSRWGVYMISVTRIVGLLGILVTVSACDPAEDRPAPRVNIPFTPEISINEVMVAQIDHAAHFIWDAVNPDNPAAEIDWLELEHHAIQLISSRAAITMGGTGVNDAMWIAQVSWREYVNQMNDASLMALDSARSRDRVGLSSASDRQVESCESCHLQFKPSIPTEGFSHPH